MKTNLLPLSLLLMAACLSPSTVGAARHKAKAPAPPPPQPTYAERPEAMALAEEIAARRGLDRLWVRQAIGQASLQPQVVKLMTPQPSNPLKNWDSYRRRVIDPVRIRAGVNFWRTHHRTLARAEKKFGVPAEIIVGILGIETLYGRHMGSFRVIDTLATLAFDFPPEHPRARERSQFFKSELEYLLSLKRQRGVDPLTLQGSYAGAMGMSQFMPSSWARFAIDFDGDGRVDLFKSPADAIGSVANYFKTFNWQPGLPTHYNVDFDLERLDLPNLLAPDILPTFSVNHFMDKGAVLDQPGQQHPGLLALVELRNGEQRPSYVAGTENFYVITRYNWSSQYAMAVIHLGHEVAQAVNRVD